MGVEGARGGQPPTSPGVLAVVFFFFFQAMAHALYVVDYCYI